MLPGSSRHAGVPIAVILIFALSVLSVPARTQAAVSPGVIPATFQVDPNGGADYTIPIDVPPGIEGVQPRLELVYDSQLGNGPLGVGWMLQGVDRIERTPAILAVDGYAGGINYDARDRFALTGQRLIEVNDGSGKAYHTELESWTRGVASGTAPTGPDSFSAKNRRGWTLEFGTTSDSRVTAYGQSFARVWALAAMRDLNGNTVSFRYAQSTLASSRGGTIASPGQYYPVEIAYTANGSTAANRFVRFAWEPRPDVITEYVGGYPVTTAARLASITTFVGQTAVRHYVFSYETAPATGRSRLLEVRLDSGDSAASLTPTRFTPYQDLQAQFQPKQKVLSGTFGSDNGWTNPDQFPRQMGDVNGDGRLDAVGFKVMTSQGQTGGVQVALGGPAGFTLTPPWNGGFASGTAGYTTQTSTPRFLADVNGDGMADVIGFSTAGVQTALSTGTSFDATKWPALNAFKSPVWNPLYDVRTLGDVNGDGAADLIGFKSGVQVALAGTNGFSAPALWASGFSHDQKGPDGAVWDQYTPRVMADVNGDHRADVVGFGKDKVYVALSNGEGFSTAGWDNNYPYFGYSGGGYNPRYYPRLMADVNGDGMMDIVGFKGGIQVGLSTGKGFLPPQKWYDGMSHDTGWTLDMPRITTDVNGDGMADVVGFNGRNQGDVEVLLSTGSLAAGAFAAGRWATLASFGSGWTAAQNPQMIADVTGDGLSDVVGFGKDGIYAAPGAGRVPDLLTRITDGLGGRIEIAYSNLSDPNVYRQTGSLATTAAGTASGQGKIVSARAYSTNPLPADATIPVFAPQRLQGGRFNVVAAHTLTNDPALNRAPYSYAHTYLYTNAAYDLSGRGWLGFETTVDRDAALGLEIQSSFHQVFPFTQRMRQVDIACGGKSSDPLCAPGKKMGTHRLVYLCEPETSCDTEGQAVFQPYPKVYQVLESREQTDKYEYGVYGFSLGKSFGYDRQGNRTLDADLGYVDRSTGRNLSTDNDVYTYSRYDNDTSASRWHVGYELASRVTAKPDGGRLAAVSCTSPPSYDPDDFSLKASHYSDDGRLLTLAHCLWDNGRSAWSKTSYGDHDRFGHAQAETSPAGQVTNTEYETRYNTYPNRLLQPANDQGVRLEEWYGFDPRFGLQVAKTDFNGVPRILVVDPFGRVVAKQGPVPKITGGTVKLSRNQVSPFVTGTFNFAGQSVVTLSTKTLKSDGSGLYYLTEIVQKWPVSDTPVSAPFQDWIDGMDRTYRRVAAAACSGQGPATVDVENDARNQVTRESLPYYPGATVRWQTTVYDAYGRPRQQQEPGGDGSKTATTRFLYTLDSQGEIVTETRVADPESASYVRKLTYRYYPSKQQLTRMEVVSAGGATSNYTYDRLGRPLSAADPSNQKTSQTYDSMGRQATLTAPGLGQVVLAFGANGQKSSETDGYGVTRYGYDALGRLTSATRPDGSTVTVRWDKPNTPYALGHPYLSSVTQGGAEASSYEYAYGVYGQPATVTQRVAGVTEAFTTGMEYDPLERVIRHTYPDGAAEVRDYDLCHLRSVSLDGTTYAVFEAWSAGGQPERVVYGNRVNTIVRAYSPTGQVLHHRVDDARGTALLSQKLTWDLLGQISTIDDELGGTYSQKFAYENLRLASAAGAYGTIAYGYDTTGNLKKQGPVSFEYDGYQVKSGTANGRQVFSASYGTMGRTDRMEVEGVSWNFGYDSRNRVVQAGRGDGAAERYVYGPDGARVMAFAPDGTKTVYVLGTYQVTYPASGPPQRTKFVSSPSGIIAAVVGGATPKAYYFHHNVVFTTLLITAADGSKLAQPVFSPYGSPVGGDSVEGVQARYAGQPLDSFTRLYLFAARSYNPFTGRFLTPDSQLGGAFDRQDALNRYAYAFNNPILFLDPTGHSNTVGDVIMFLIDAAEIVGGVAIIVASGGTLTPIGAALIGGGVSGAIYNALNINKATIGGFATAQAVGLITGLITGGVGAGGSAVTSSAVSAAESAGWSAGRQLAITIGGRVLSGATAGALASVGGQVTSNLLGGKQPFANFSGWAVLESAGVGAAGGLLSVGLGRVGQAFFRDAEEDALLASDQAGTVSRSFRGWSSLLMPFTFNTNKTVIAVAKPQW